MAISREKKEELVAQYTQLLEESRAVFLTEYSGLDVKQMEELRGDVRQADGRFHVTKNTLFRLALEKSGRPTPDALLERQLAAGFALGEVPSLAKALVEFANKDENLVMRGAILGNEVLSPEQIKALAELPSLDELRAQIIGLVSAPARNIASTVASGVRQVVNVLDAYSKKEEGAEVAA